MNRMIIAIALPFLSAPSVAAAAANQHVTDYCLVEPLRADTGRGTFPLGNFVMKARLTVSGSHYVLDAWNVMPDNSQTLEINADGTYNRSGPTRIRFIDNYNNRGRGIFTANWFKMQIKIDRVKATPEGLNIGRNYGSYTLHSRGCKWEQQ
jgi:hypothetical protein